MTVWMLTEAIEYDGINSIRLFATHDGALRAIQAIAKEHKKELNGTFFSVGGVYWEIEEVEVEN